MSRIKTPECPQCRSLSNCVRIYIRNPARNCKDYLPMGWVCQQCLFVFFDEDALLVAQA